MNLTRLAEPFAPEHVGWRVQRAGQTGQGKVWAAVAAYIDNRTIQERLDEVCDVGGWRNEYRYEASGGVLLCGISINVGGEWVTKWDGAPASSGGGNAELAVKGALSNAMKRAATQWGIGRYLYHVKESFAIIAEENDRTARYQPAKEAQGNKKGYPAFKWHPPTLPAWALPPAAKDDAPKPASAPQVPTGKGGAVSNSLLLGIRLPGTKAHLHGHGGKYLAEVPRDELTLVRDALREVPGASKYAPIVDKINEYLEAVRLAHAD